MQQPHGHNNNDNPANPTTTTTTRTRTTPQMMFPIRMVEELLYGTTATTATTSTSSCYYYFYYYYYDMLLYATSLFLVFCLFKVGFVTKPLVAANHNGGEEEEERLECNDSDIDTTIHNGNDQGNDDNTIAIANVDAEVEKTYTDKEGKTDDDDQEEEEEEDSDDELKSNDSNDQMDGDAIGFAWGNPVLQSSISSSYYYLDQQEPPPTKRRRIFLASSHSNIEAEAEEEQNEVQEEEWEDNDNSRKMDNEDEDPDQDDDDNDDDKKDEQQRDDKTGRKSEQHESNLSELIKSRIKDLQPYSGQYCHKQGTRKGNHEAEELDDNNKMQYEAEEDDRYNDASNEEVKQQGDDIQEKLLSRFDSKWPNKYKELLAYKEKHGHTLVPQKQLECKPLGSWVQRQRKAYSEGTLIPEQQKLLEDAGFVWNVLHQKKFAGLN